MALATYSDLQQQIAGWMERDDLASIIPDFIALAESELNKKLETLDMQVVTDLTIAAQRVTSPTDELAAIRLYIDGDPKQALDYVTPEFLFTSRGGSESGKPVMFTREGSEYVFAPSPDQTYTGKLLYRQKVPALTDSNTTNWLLTNHPEIYLHGALAQAAIYVMDDDRAARWLNLFKNGIKELNDLSETKEFSGHTLQVRSA